MNTDLFAICNVSFELLILMPPWRVMHPTRPMERNTP